MSKPEPKRVEVTLAKPHTHAGKDCKAGDKISVTETQRAWLAKHGVINSKESK